LPGTAQLTLETPEALLAQLLRDTTALRLISGGKVMGKTWGHGKNDRSDHFTGAFCVGNGWVAGGCSFPKIPYV